MLTVFKSVLGGAALVFFGIVAAIAFFVHHFRPANPDATIGFSPGEMITQPPVFLTILLLFVLGFAATWFLSRRRPRLPNPFLRK